MFALVCSDSHKMFSKLQLAIEENPDCNVIFFLGDGSDDVSRAIEMYPQKKFYAVCGNCDWRTNFDYVAYAHYEGNTVVATHGHRFGVKETLFDVMKHAEGVLANVVFYGHTHKKDFHYEPSFKMFLLNPGALCEGSYARVEFNKYGIECEFKHV